MSEDREIMPVCVECGEPFGDERLCPAHTPRCPRYLDEHAEEHHCCDGLGAHRRCCRVCHPQPWELRTVTEGEPWTEQRHAVDVIAEFLADGSVSDEEHEGYVADAHALLRLLWLEGWLVVPASIPGGHEPAS